MTDSTDPVTLTLPEAVLLLALRITPYILRLFRNQPPTPVGC